MSLTAALATATMLAAICAAASAQTTYKYITAIAFDDVAGIYDRPTGLYRRGTVEDAWARCRRAGGISCTLAMPDFTSCGALSKGSKEGCYGLDDSKDIAEARALDSCRKDGNPSCKVLIALCSETGTINPGPSTPIVPHSPSTQPQPQRRACPPNTQQGMGGCYGY